MRIAHIGLEKSTTSSLQRHVLPRLTRSHRIRYVRARDIENFLNAPIDKPYKEKFSSKGPVFISADALIGMDPWDWQVNCARNLEYFGAETTIALILRRPKDYMQAVFQHLSHHQGLLIEPEAFFRNAENYDRNNPHPLFKADDLDLQKLILLYADAFDRVVVQKYETLGDLRFLKAVFDMTADEVAVAERNLAKRQNERPFSQAAVGFSQKLQTLLSPNPDSGTRHKVLELRRYRYWRKFIQGLFDRVYPYRPYQIDWSRLPFIDLEKLDAAYEAIPEFQILRKKSGLNPTPGSPSSPVERN